MEVPMSKLSSTTLMIAAVILLVLALLFVATPLMRVSNMSSRTGVNRQYNSQGFSSQGNGTQGQNFPRLNSGTQGQGNATTPNQQFNGSSRRLIGFSFLGGMAAIAVYALALLASLAAAVGMFLTKRWGQILGIVMAGIYLLLSLMSFLPIILLGSTRAMAGLNVVLTILHLVLAIAVIVFAVIPTRKVTAPAAPNTPIIQPSVASA
jgi:hypothetical protein